MLKIIVGLLLLTSVAAVGDIIYSKRLSTGVTPQQALCFAQCAQAVDQATNGSLCSNGSPADMQSVTVMRDEDNTFRAVCKMQLSAPASEVPIGSEFQGVVTE